MSDLSFTPDPRRTELERMAREVLASKQFHAPATTAFALIDAILAAGWQPPAEPVGYITGYPADGKWHIPFDGEAFTLDEAIADLHDACGSVPDVQWCVLEVRTVPDA